MEREEFGWTDFALSQPGFKLTSSNVPVLEEPYLLAAARIAVSAISRRASYCSSTTSPESRPLGLDPLLSQPLHQQPYQRIFALKDVLINLLMDLQLAMRFVNADLHFLKSSGLKSLPHRRLVALFMVMHP